jgi:hypothetical protein
VIGVALILVGLAGASLLLPWDPVYDPWGWLVWGREVGALALDTSSGPSWKPLPVIFTTPFAAFGNLAPDLWLFVARLGWLAAVALAALLASGLVARRGGGPWERAGAAAIAALGLILLADDFTPWLRQFAGGLSEPLLTALVLAAVERGLAGRRRAALALAVAAALIRPETWPFLLAYAVWLWRREPGMRAVAAGAVVAVGVLWVVPDLVGSGSALTGAERAREGTGSPPTEALEVLGRSAALPLAALWGGLVVAAVDARRRGDRAVLAVAAGALAWIGLVAAMAAGGYAGLPRFVAPAAGVVCALGASGLSSLAARAVGGWPDGARARAVAVAAGALAAALLVQGGFRAVELRSAASTATRLSEAEENLRDIVGAADPERLRGCDPIAVGAIEGQTALAWRLDVPIDAVEVKRTPPGHGLYLERVRDGWEAMQLGCPNFD